MSCVVEIIVFRFASHGVTFLPQDFSSWHSVICSLGAGSLLRLLYFFFFSPYLEDNFFYPEKHGVANLMAISLSMFV
jgi:hypothetical protein